MFKNKPALIIGASIPCMWILVYALSHFGVFDVLESTDLSEMALTCIIELIANIPVLVFIGYGIYSAVTAKPTIPKVKERMPWEKGSPLAVDQEWREKTKETKESEE